MMRVKAGVCKAGLALCAALLVMIFAVAWLWNTAFSFSPLVQGCLLAAWLCGLLAAWVAAQRSGLLDALVRRRWQLLAVVVLAVACAQFSVGLATRQTLTDDYGSVVNGALLYAQQGRSAAFAQQYQWYLNHWPNNRGIFFLLALFFRVLTALGFGGQWYTGMVCLGHLSFALAAVCTFAYLGRAFSAKASLAFLPLYALFAPVYFQSSVAYTDTLSIWVAPAALFLWQLGRDAGRLRTRLAAWAGCAVCLGVGYEIKGSVGIVLVALCCEALVCLPWRRTLAALAVLGCGFVLVHGAAGLVYMRSGVVTPELRQTAEMPTAFWVMMGLGEPDGAYSVADEREIMYRQTKEERQAYAAQVIRSRLDEKGAAGLPAFLMRKTARTFGAGNGEIYYSLSRGPLQPGHAVYTFILEDGPHFGLFNNAAQCVYLSFYVLGAAGALAALRRRGMPPVCAPWAALAGFYLFMMLWESNHRQLVNQWPLYWMVAAVGLAALGGFAARRLPQNHHAQNEQN